LKFSHGANVMETASAKVVRLATGSGRNDGGTIQLTEDAQRLLDIICSKTQWSQEQALENALNFLAQEVRRSKADW
jgi:molybdenum-dependent DNA-binding transcriptional regulator ModE